jgi:hypothetical protein
MESALLGVLGDMFSLHIKLRLLDDRWFFGVGR